MGHARGGDATGRMRELLYDSKLLQQKLEHLVVSAVCCALVTVQLRQQPPCLHTDSSDSVCSCAGTLRSAVVWCFLARPPRTQLLLLSGHTATTTAAATNRRRCVTRATCVR
jgi:hypothetical protein